MKYQSPFENWYSCSTVHKPLPDFTCGTGLVLFPPELVPGVGHPLVDKLGTHAARRLMMRKLESYNAFTEKLEYKAVMTASIKIAESTGFWVERTGREGGAVYRNRRKSSRLCRYRTDQANSWIFQNCRRLLRRNRRFCEAWRSWSEVFRPSSPMTS